MTDDADPVAMMGAAIMNAIVDSCRDEIGHALIDPTRARHALIVALAMLLEADRSIVAPGDIRRSAEKAAINLRVQLRVLRAHWGATGIRAWDATPVRLN